MERQCGRDGGQCDDRAVRDNARDGGQWIGSWVMVDLWWVVGGSQEIMPRDRVNRLCQQVIWDIVLRDCMGGYASDYVEGLRGEMQEIVGRDGLPCDRQMWRVCRDRKA